MERHTQKHRYLNMWIPPAVFLAALVALVLAHFVWLGTPLGVGNDTNGNCPLDNVPPWWPGWLPT
ncbi:hypothetical protein [Streptomyces beigongshangae]|uniref:hypothetical protein n=1 Tax=Streptomyces beigongshangae TaxID=2841597 RepID=UPI001C858B64|nr:hypothetical protein [Streptomyces sp. REN17]